MQLILQPPVQVLQKSQVCIGMYSDTAIITVYQAVTPNAGIDTGILFSKFAILGRMCP